jgi:hypothetical protein
MGENRQFSNNYQDGLQKNSDAVAVAVAWPARQVHQSSYKLCVS